MKEKFNYIFLAVLINNADIYQFSENTWAILVENRFAAYLWKSFYFRQSVIFDWRQSEEIKISQSVITLISDQVEFYLKSK